MTPSPDVLGRRVCARVLLPDGSATDVIGTATASDDTSLEVLREATGQPVVLSWERVVALRVVPARRPRLRDVTIEGLARLAVASADALSAPMRGRAEERLGGWMLGRPGGDHGVSPTVPLGEPGLPLEDAVEAVERHHRGLGVAPSVLLPLPVGADVHADPLGRLLLERGWTPTDSTAVWAGLVATALGRTTPAPDVTARASAPGLRPGVRQAELWRDDRRVAHGTAVVDGGWVGLHDVHVVPHERGRGLGRALVGTLLMTARDLGADRVHARTAENDDAARALCSGLGLRVHHRSVRLDAAG